MKNDRGGRQIYLSRKMVTKDHDQVQEAKRRIGQGWSAFGKVDIIKRDKNLPMRLKRKAFNECILPVMTYGFETWSLSNTQLEKLVTNQRKMEKIMVEVTLKDRKSTDWTRKQSGMTDIIRNIRESKHRWADHVARRRHNKWTNRASEWIPCVHKRPRGWLWYYSGFIVCKICARISCMLHVWPLCLEIFQPLLGIQWVHRELTELCSYWIT